MGDRNNIVIHQPNLHGGEITPLYLYGHSAGNSLTSVVVDALELTKGHDDRRNDPIYFSRILFSEMVKGDYRENRDGQLFTDLRGYGLSVGLCPDQDRYNIQINVKWDVVPEGNWIQFKLFINYYRMDYTPEQFIEAYKTGNLPTEVDPEDYDQYMKDIGLEHSIIGH